MSKIYVGLDNGVSGSVAIIGGELTPFFCKTPVKKELSYTKTKQYITRIDFPKLISLLQDKLYDTGDILVLLERVMVNPTRFKASMSGLRAFEATLIAVEQLKLPMQYEDSKRWQKQMLPTGLKGDELKKASLEVGNRLFPQFSSIKHPDRDSLLMAEWARRNQL